MRTLLRLSLALFVFVVPATAQTTFRPDAEGFIRNWLVLAPIPLAGQSGAQEIHTDFLDGEAAIKPSANSSTQVGGAARTWAAHQTFSNLIDFRESFDKAGGEYVAGYAVAYVVAPRAMDVTLALGTNDQGRAWLNGKEILVFEETRVLDVDADKIPVSLVEGQNVLVLKVINEVNSWQACARFLRGQTPVTDLEISLAPR